MANFLLSGLLPFVIYLSTAIAQPEPELSCQPAVGSSKAESFDGCNKVAWVPDSPVSYTWYYRLSPGPLSDTIIWRGGLKVDVNAVNGQWTGFGWGSAMIGSNAVVVRKCTTCPSGARIDGFKLTDYDEASKVPGSFNISDATAEVAPDGTLVATFTVILPSQAAPINGGPFQHIAAVGPLAPDGSLRAHTSGGFPYGVQSASLKAATLAGDPPQGAAADPAPGLDPSSSSTSDPPQNTTPPTTESEAAPSPEGGLPALSSSSCTLSTASGESKAFSACADIGPILKVHWKALNTMGTKSNTSDGSGSTAGSGSGSNITVEIGMNGDLLQGQWVAIGFPTAPGQMIGSTAMVLTSCAPPCPEGAKLQDYYLAAKDSSQVNPPGHLKISDVMAGSGNSGSGSVVGFFTVSLPQTAATNGQLPIIYAHGPLDSSGRLQQHEIRGAASLDLVSGSASSSSNSSAANKKNAHGWLMAVGWTIILGGAVVARSFRTLGPIWFQIHRAAQLLGLACVLSAFIIIFSALGGKKTVYTLHFNLGVAAFTLGMVQLSALLFRPHLDSKWRRTWALSHHWIGRAAILVAVANIYYGIIHVKRVGSWAVIVYSIVFGLIIGIGALKEAFDYLRLPPPALMKDKFSNYDEEKEAAVAVGVEGLRRRSGAESSAVPGGKDGSPTGSAAGAV